MADHWFPDLRQVLLVRARVVARSRMGSDPIEAGVLQPSVLETALDRATFGPWPRNDLWTRAALLLRGIVQEHPFVDGNKRCGFEIVDTTLVVNGWMLVASADEIVRFQLAVAKGELALDDMAAWLRGHAESLMKGGEKS